MSVRGLMCRVLRTGICAKLLLCPCKTRNWLQDPGAKAPKSSAALVEEIGKPNTTDQGQPRRLNCGLDIAQKISHQPFLPWREPVKA